MCTLASANKLRICACTEGKAKRAQRKHFYIYNTGGGGGGGVCIICAALRDTVNF